MVYPYLSPPTRGAETMAKFDVKEFTVSIVRVFREILPLLSEKGMADIWCCLVPIGRHGVCSYPMINIVTGALEEKGALHYDQV